MSHRDDHRLEKWLDAELNAASDAAEADRLFAVLASSHLPRLQPPAGLAARIVAAVPARSFLPPARVLDPTAFWLGRAAVAAGVVLLGVGLALASPREVVSLGAAGLSLAARFLHDGLASAGAALGVWRASLDLLAALGQAAAVTVTTGVMPFLIAANLAVATAAFVGLRRLLAPREECV